MDNIIVPCFFDSQCTTWKRRQYCNINPLVPSGTERAVFGIFGEYFVFVSGGGRLNFLQYKS